MFNVRALVNPFTQVTNPNIAIAWEQSNGYTTDGAGKRTPQFTTVYVQAQIQALSAQDLRHVDGLNISGVMRSVYIYGNVAGIVRTDQQGGDILQFAEIPGGTVKNWLVSTVVETWPTWAHVIVTLQA